MNNRISLHHVYCCLFLTFGLFTTAAAAEDSQDQMVQYINMSPSFVVNYGEPTLKLRFARADVSLRVNTKSGAASIEHHMPALRNEMVLLLSKQTQETIGDASGRENIRQQALTQLNDYLNNEVGASPVDDLLFTSFVVQH